MPWQRALFLVETVFAGLFCIASHADPGGTISWGAPTVFSLDVTNTQLFRPYVGVSMNNYTGQTLVYFSADADVQDTNHWSVAFDDYNGSLTQLELSWPNGLADISPYIALNPGWLPPGVTNVHQHWEGTIGHVYCYAETGSGGDPDIHIQLGAPLHFVANAAPTVELVRNGFWHAGQPVVLTANGHDAEADLWSTVYLEYRWDFNGDGVWDTDWSPSNQITNTFNTPGITKVVVQVMDQGYALNGWNSPMGGETWTDALTNYVLATAADPPVPSLQIATVMDGLEIAWPTNEVPYRLEENGALDSAGWVANTNVINMLNGTNYVSIASPMSNRFYRLTFP